jgi:hypothetical protein
MGLGLMSGKDTLNLGQAHSVVLPLVSLLGQMFQVIRQVGQASKGKKVKGSVELFGLLS